MRISPASSFRLSASDLLTRAREQDQKSHYRDNIELLRPLVAQGGALRHSSQAHYLFLKALITAKPQGWTHMRPEDVAAIDTSHREAALAHFEGIPESMRKNLTFNTLHARILRNLGRHAEALAVLEVFYTKDTAGFLDRVESVAVLADLQGKAGHFDKGIRMITDAIKASAFGANSIQLHYLKAKLMAKDGQTSHAAAFIHSHSGQYGVLRFDNKANDLLDRLEAIPPQRRDRGPRPA